VRGNGIPVPDEAGHERKRPNERAQAAGIKASGTPSGLVTPWITERLDLHGQA
jgi:hypothetical protein